MPMRRMTSLSPVFVCKSNSSYSVKEISKQICQTHFLVLRFWLKHMKRVFTLVSLAFATTACFMGASPEKTKKPAAAAPAKTHKAGSRTAKSRAGSSAASAVKVRYVRGRNGKLVRVAAKIPSAPSYQLHPDSERYQQIQQALSDKGYYKGEVNGQWSDDSVDALKRFQADQKLDDDGHLSALTLIGLGLGPKHDRDLSAPAAAATPAIVPGSSAPKTGSSVTPPVPSVPNQP